MSRKLTRSNPGVRGLSGVFATVRYVSLRETGQRELVSETIRAMKLGQATQLEVETLARHVLVDIAKHMELVSAAALVPMPRRTPGLPSDLLPLAQALSQHTGQHVLEDWLVRLTLPQGGVHLLERDRFSAKEHARTLQVAKSPPWPTSVIVLDNVLTTGGSMLGALRAIRRDTQDLVQAYGLSVTVSGEFVLEQDA